MQYAGRCRQAGREHIGHCFNRSIVLAWFPVSGGVFRLFQMPQNDVAQFMSAIVKRILPEDIFPYKIYSIAHFVLGSIHRFPALSSPGRRSRADYRQQSKESGQSPFFVSHVISAPEAHRPRTGAGFSTPGLLPVHNLFVSSI